MNTLSFNVYQKFANFEHDQHKLDIGNAYTHAKSGAEMLSYLAQSNKIQKITDPLNNDECHYYSVLFDGSSNAKTNDEKELFLIKTCLNGSASINVMSLECVEDTTAPGLKISLENSIEKMKFTFDRKTKEVDMCSDGAAVNKAAYNLIKPDMGEHYLLILCPAHKHELAIKDAFKISEFNNEVGKDLTDAFYFFKKATLRWRLIKRQAVFMDLPLQRYKQDSGTRWVEHQHMPPQYS